jgi:nicotinamidase-related amidase
MPLKVDLLVIDPQIDFCDPSDGTLYVDGAEQDMNRLADMVSRISGKIDDIHATLDSHHLFDVAHPLFWRDRSGNNPNPFTIITRSEVLAGDWMPRPDLTQRMLDYLEKLELSGRYPLCIWPPHCLIGTPGHAVWGRLFDAFCSWEADSLKWVDYVIKGSNPFTEHYSAVQAEVPDPEDDSTQFNAQLINTLKKADIVAVAGEALSHCLANTVRDIAAAFGDESAIKKVVLLEDATSPIARPDGLYKKRGEEFVHDLIQKGMQVTTTDKFLV